MSNNAAVQIPTHCLVRDLDCIVMVASLHCNLVSPPRNIVRQVLESFQLELALAVRPDKLSCEVEAHPPKSGEANPNEIDHCCGRLRVEFFCGGF